MKQQLFFLAFSTLVFAGITACGGGEQKRFTRTEFSETGINFENNLPYTENFNTYTYRNFYNGGGIALGDINNDGLLDILFTGNIVDNKLYLNKGNWKFEDITEKAGLACPGVWCTGASMVDINGDGFLDIYVCKAGSPEGERRNNELFINKGDLTFEEQSAEYGLDLVGMSIHSAFFDYDRDGDLDCYILTNSIRSVGGFDFEKDQRNTYDKEGNKFFRNDEGHFVDVTKEAGFYSSNIGYGLGITLSDFNQDDWPDLFISNDFFERDYLYINNQDGTFSEQADSSFSSFSMGSMGADASDLDNDLLPDLFVTEMLPETVERRRTKILYDTWDKHANAIEAGYGHQYSRNVLQRNMGGSNFMEIGRLSGVAATEWSWASLIQDFDNDGLKDIFISNGIYKDLLDRDYLAFFIDDARIQAKIAKKEAFLTLLVDSMPSHPVVNYMYKNKGQFQFEMVSEAWGLGDETFSNGSAYGDLDNDGDLDLVVNNANMSSYVYRNNTDTAVQKSIQFKLIGSGKNTAAIGAKVRVKAAKGQFFLENFTSKGFESSTEGPLLLGLGSISSLDTVEVCWPDGLMSFYYGLAANQLHTFKQTDGKAQQATLVASHAPTFEAKHFLDFVHQEINFNLFARERLLIEMNGFDGPGLAVGDVNGDKIDDVFCGGGKNQTSVLYVSKNGRSNFTKVTAPFEADYRAEIVKSYLFDSDGDGDLDLYVAHGGKSFSEMALELNDLLYINDGKGNFSKKADALGFASAYHTGDVVFGDINKDGKTDIVLSEKMKNSFFGRPCSVYVLYNQGANMFKEEAPDCLKNIGMVGALALLDADKDGWLDLVAAGHWMPIQIFYNEKGHFSAKKAPKKLPNTSGLWNTIATADLDGDGDLDLLCGNQGLNSFYTTKSRMFINDFDGNGASEQLVCQEIDGKYYPIHDLDEVFSQMPFLKKKFLHFADCAHADMLSLFGENAVAAAAKYDIDELETIVLKNEGSEFVKVSLPREIQYSSVYRILPDIKAGTSDFGLYFGGNNYRVKPQFGRQDASQGWYLSGKQSNNQLSFGISQNLGVRGQIRSMNFFMNKIIFGINNDHVKICNRASK